MMPWRPHFGTPRLPCTQQPIQTPPRVSRGVWHEACAACNGFTVTKMPSLPRLPSSSIIPSPTPSSPPPFACPRLCPLTTRYLQTHAQTQRMFSGGRCLAFALRLPHGASVATRSHGVVLGGARPPFGGRRMLSTEASPVPAAPAPSKGIWKRCEGRGHGGASSAGRAGRSCACVMNQRGSKT